jgi:hypothetical protein
MSACRLHWKTTLEVFCQPLLLLTGEPAWYILVGLVMAGGGLLACCVYTTGYW